MTNDVKRLRESWSSASPLPDSRRVLAARQASGRAVAIGPRRAPEPCDGFGD
ncbi:MAG: hypothetical protein V3S31_00630 [Dehalococcoidia bacterium]